MNSNTMGQHKPDLSPAASEEEVLRLTHREWRRLLEERSFLEDETNRFQPPRRYHGRPVQIVPAPSERN